MKIALLDSLGNFHLKVEVIKDLQGAAARISFPSLIRTVS
jgi:hypothetical protein